VDAGFRKILILPVRRVLFFLLPGMLFFSCRKETVEVANSDVVLRIRHLAFDEKLKPSFPLRDSAGVLLSFSKFQYYLSGIRLETENPMETYREPIGYHLVKALDNSGELVIQLKGLPKLPYRRLVLKIGLDSLSNHKAGGQGALDPGNGMYWSWSGEYKFMVMEGNFQYSDTSGAFLFHIAGDASFRSIPISLTDSSGNPRPFSSEITIDAQMPSLFGAPHPVDFRIMNNVMSTETGALKIADNYTYAGFFRLAGMK